jgi:hypothetical protein
LVYLTALSDLGMTLAYLENTKKAAKSAGTEKGNP